MHGYKTQPYSAKHVRCSYSREMHSRCGKGAKQYVDHVNFCLQDTRLTLPTHVWLDLLRRGRSWRPTAGINRVFGMYHLWPQQVLDNFLSWEHYPCFVSEREEEGGMPISMYCTVGMNWLTPMRRRYGRIGTNGVAQNKIHASNTEAESFAQKYVWNKMDYVEWKAQLSVSKFFFGLTCEEWSKTSFGRGTKLSHKPVLPGQSSSSLRVKMKVTKLKLNPWWRTTMMNGDQQEPLGASLIRPKKMEWTCGIYNAIAEPPWLEKTKVLFQMSNCVGSWKSLEGKSLRPLLMEVTATQYFAKGPLQKGESDVGVYVRQCCWSSHLI